MEREKLRSADYYEGVADTYKEVNDATWRWVFRIGIGLNVIMWGSVLVDAVCRR
jgi:hypothetical protein